MLDRRYEYIPPSQEWPDAEDMKQHLVDEVVKFVLDKGETSSSVEVSALGISIRTYM